MKNKSKKPVSEKVTMKSIAEEAGVTLTTVSRILNNKGDKYADKTVKKIHDIAARHKYRPNALVIGMQTGHTGTAGVMLPCSSTFYSQIITGIHNEFIQQKTIMLLSWNNRSLNEREETLERQIIHQMVDRRVEGIILRPSSEEFERSYFEEIWDRSVPLILIDRKLEKVETDFVGTEDFLGGRMAAEHLIQFGHRTILFAGSSQNTSTSRLREDGFRQVLSETPNTHCPESITAMTPDTAKQIREKLSVPDRPTAIFCYNDDIAYGIAEILREMNLSIPEDISIMGFGHKPTTNQGLILTTFNQHPVEIGIAAAKLYQERIRKPRPDSFSHQLIKPELVVGASTRAI